MTVNNKEFLFPEKYRPKTIQDIILPETLKQNIKKWIQDGEIPNLLLVSKTPGLGKSSLAHVLINEIQADAIFINISLDRNIDTLRTRIQGFVSTVGFENKPKIVVLDEFDGASNILQSALRGFIEEFSKSARFILTANYKEKIIEPLQNRLQIIDFDELFKTHKKELLKQTAQRVQEILKYEGINYKKEDLLLLLKTYFPSNRKILISIQEHTQNDTLHFSENEIKQATEIQDAIQAIKNKDYETYRKIIQELPNPEILFTEIYKKIDDFDITKRPQITIIVSKYSYQSSFARDSLVNIAAMGAEIMNTL